MSPTLRPEVKEKWLEALRSGRYKQGKGYLNYSLEGVNYYCCLGVLCEIAVEEGVATKTVVPPSLDSGDEVGNEAFSRGFQNAGRYVAQVDDSAGFTMPPAGLVTWAYGDELPRRHNQWQVGSEDDLSGLNDDDEYTFEQIANAIEESL